MTPQPMNTYWLRRICVEINSPAEDVSTSGRLFDVDSGVIPRASDVHDILRTTATPKLATFEIPKFCTGFAIHGVITVAVPTAK